MGNDRVVAGKHTAAGASSPGATVANVGDLDFFGGERIAPVAYPHRCALQAHANGRVFPIELAVIESGRKANRFQNLVIIAAPAFLGVLRGELSTTTRSLVATEIDKHVRGEEPANIAALIDAESQ